MSSINTNNFAKNLGRLSTTSDKVISPTKTNELKPSTFENLLLVTENKEENEVDHKVPQQVVDLEILTNKEDGEVIPVEKFVPKGPTPYIIGDIPLDEEPSSVKIESPPVNPLAEESTELIGLVPQAPEIVSSRRFSLPKGRDQNAPALNKSEIQGIIVTAGRFHGIDPKLGLAVAQVESAFKPNAVSSDGHYSKGVFQLLDTTAGDMMDMTGMEEPYKPFDPSMNSFLGLGYLRRLHDLFSKDTNLTSKVRTFGAKSADDLEKIALAAYNCGEGNVVRAQKLAESLGKDPRKFSSIEPHLPRITRGYVKRIGNLKAQFDVAHIESNDHSDDLA